MTGSAVLGILPGKPAYQAAKTLTPHWGWGMGPKFGSAGACRTACLLHACEGAELRHRSWLPGWLWVGGWRWRGALTRWARMQGARSGPGYAHLLDYDDAPQQDGPVKVFDGLLCILRRQRSRLCAVARGEKNRERYLQEHTAGREHAYPRVLVVHKAKAARISCARIKHHPGLFDLQSQQCISLLINTCTVTDKQQEKRT